jgi:hypothetical protein
LRNSWHTFNEADTDMAGSILRWGSKVINPEQSGIDRSMPLQHLAATLAGHGHIRLIDFVTFKLLDLSPHNHVRVENSVSIPDLLSRLLIQFISFN